MADEATPKLKAENNPGYQLVIFHGQPSESPEIAVKNRETWNRYMASEIEEDTIARLLEAGTHSREELTPFSEEERKAVQAIIAERTGGTIKDFTAIADFSNVEFDLGFLAVGFVFPWANFSSATFSAADFSSATFSGRAEFGMTTFGLAEFGSATFSGGANFESAIFDDRANFERATFSDGANFESTTFSNRTFFRKATFSGGANFSNAAFSKRAFFGNATFSDVAGFSKATFSVGADFSSTTFSDRTHFESATFSGATKFESVTFSGAANFGDATFSGAAGFSKATFSVGAEFGSATFSTADFSSATFSDYWAYFRNATFSGGADFSNVTFSAADFGSTTFSGAAVFEDVKMTSTTSFREAKFSEVPRFSGATLHEGTEWEAKWPEPPKDAETARRFVYAYARLKMEMDRLKKYRDELDFFAREIQCQRVVDGFLKGLPIAIYGALCGHGRYYMRPLGILLVVVILGAVPIRAHFGGGWSLATFTDHPIGGGAMGLSFANTFGLLGIRKDLIDPGLLQSLPGWLKVVATIQTILGIVLLFLFGLSIRNRFRMKS